MKRVSILSAGFSPIDIEKSIVLLPEIGVIH